MRRLLSADGDVIAWFEDAPADDGFVIRHEANEIPVIESNKVTQNMDEGLHHGKDFRHAACVPDIIALKWLNEEGLWIDNKDHWKGIKRKLNDPDYRWLRTWTGRL